MPESFGARLRRRREEQQIDLRAIAEQTKIKLSMLEALERDDLSQWPAGIFRRAYVRSYAHCIGFDPAAMVQEFLEAHPDPEAIAAAAAAAAQQPVAGGTVPDASVPQNRLRTMVGSAIGSLARLRRGSASEEPGIAPDAASPSTTSIPLRGETPGIEISLEASLGDPFTRDPLDAGTLPVEPPVPQSVAEPVGPHAEVPPDTLHRDARPEELPIEAPIGAPEVVPQPDWVALAELCTAFGRITGVDDIRPLLADAAQILDAAGLIVWLWDERARALRALLVHGYPDRVIAQLPAVPADAENATAAAFRSARTCAISGSAEFSGALVVPLLTGAGCSGVLAIELQNGREQSPLTRAAATIIAAVLSQVSVQPSQAEVPVEPEMNLSSAVSFR